MGDAAQSSKVGGKDFSLAGWRLILTDLGISAVNVLRRAGMPDDLFARPEPRVSTIECFRLWEAVVTEADDPLLPLKLGQAVSFEAFDPAIFAASCSPNLDIAMQRIATHKKLCGPLRLEVIKDADTTRIEVHFPPSGGQPPAAFITAELIFFVQLARLCTRANVRPLEVTTPFDLPEPAAAYADYFGVPITRGRSVAVTFSAGDATRPFLTANERMWEFFAPQLQQRLAQLETKATTGERARAALLELLPSGLASVDGVAKKLGVSKRTLQRKLQAEDLNFQQLLDATREELARHYLRSSTMTGAEISFLLGYEDPNSFFRAFHTWTGQTPETVRAELRH